VFFAKNSDFFAATAVDFRVFSVIKKINRNPNAPFSLNELSNSLNKLGFSLNELTDSLNKFGCSLNEFGLSLKRA